MTAASCCVFQQGGGTERLWAGSGGAVRGAGGALRSSQFAASRGKMRWRKRRAAGSAGRHACAAHLGAWKLGTRDAIFWRGDAWQRISQAVPWLCGRGPDAAARAARGTRWPRAIPSTGCPHLFEKRSLEASRPSVPYEEPWSTPHATTTECLTC
jgi:hypothetical protein